MQAAETIGCFEVERISVMRWRVRNTLTGHGHITYGSEEDVRAQLETQSVDWARRAATGQSRLTRGQFTGGIILTKTKT